MEEKVIALSSWITSQRHLKAIKDSFVMLLPWLMFSTFALFLSSVSWISYHIKEVIEVIYYVQSGSITLFLLVLISYKLFEISSSQPLFGVITTVSMYLIIVLISSMFGYATSSLYHIEHVLFAIVLAILIDLIHRSVTSVMNYFRIFQFSSSNMMIPYQQVISMVIVFIILTLANLMLILLMQQDIVLLSSRMLYGLLSIFDSYGFILFVNIGITLFWYVGLHGTNILSMIVTPLSTITLLLNAQAFANQMELPYIFAGAINAVFGNWMTYIAMLIVITLIAKSSQLREVGRVARLLTPFNINEPIIFGMPHIKNKPLLLTMLICTVTNVSVLYWFSRWNLLSRVFVMMPFTVPSPLQGYLATMDVRVVLLWVALLMVDIMLVLPTIKHLDNDYVQHESERR